jgi:hypothetical protein
MRDRHGIIAAYCLCAMALDRLLSDWASVNRLTAEWSQHSNYLQHVSFTEELMGEPLRTGGARHSE